MNSLQKINEIGPLPGDSAGTGGNPAQVEYVTGKKALDSGDFGHAAAALHNALVLYTERGDQRGIANARNQLGQLCQLRQDYQTAVTHFLAVLAICQQLEDTASSTAVQKSLIAAYRGANQLPQAMECCFTLMDGYAANNDPQGSVVTLETLADIYRQAGELTKAADAYRTIASIHRNYRHQSIAESFMAKAAALEATD